MDFFHWLKPWLANFLPFAIWQSGIIRHIFGHAFIAAALPIPREPARGVSPVSVSGSRQHIGSDADLTPA